MWSHISIFPFVFSSFVTGSSLTTEKSTLQLVGIPRRIRWLHDVTVNWSSTSHLSQEEDRLCSRSVNRILVKIWYFRLLRASLFRRRSCNVRNTRELRAKGVGENRGCAVSLLCDSLVTNSFHEILFLEIAQGCNFIICQNTIVKNVYVSLSVNKFVGSGMETNFKLPS